MAPHSEFASCERGVEPIREGHVLARIGDEDFSFGLMVRRARGIRCHRGPFGSHVSNPIKPKSPSLGKRLTHLDDRYAMQKPWRAHVSEGSFWSISLCPRHVGLPSDRVQVAEIAEFRSVPLPDVNSCHLARRRYDLAPQRGLALPYCHPGTASTRIVSSSGRSKPKC